MIGFLLFIGWANTNLATMKKEMQTKFEEQQKKIDELERDLEELKKPSP